MDFTHTKLIKTSRLPNGVILQDIADATGLLDEHVNRAIQILLS